MDHFAAIAIAHFLALLIPGVDFVLIVRTAMTSGWRQATGACLGIACANGVFIAAAFSGVALLSHPVLLDAIQLAGGAFLTYIGTAFLRSRVDHGLDVQPGAERATWRRNIGLGLASGLLNPKNAVFYLGLAAAVSTTQPWVSVLYGAWMCTVVLVWDIIVAVAFGSKRALARFGRVLPWLTTIAGGFLVLFGAGMIVSLAVSLLR